MCVGGCGVRGGGGARVCVCVCVEGVSARAAITSRLYAVILNKYQQAFLFLFFLKSK